MKLQSKTAQKDSATYSRINIIWLSDTFRGTPKPLHLPSNLSYGINTKKRKLRNNWNMHGSP